MGVIYDYQDYYRMIGLKASDQKGGYSPTESEKKKVMRQPGLFKLSWDWVFHTIQWEWQFAGRPTTFIRLHMCNLQCSRCDARYTRKRDTKEFYTEPSDISIDELMQKIIDAQDKSNTRCRDITITWWEPLLQQRTIILFLEKYWDNFDRIQIETNWTIPLLKEIQNNEKVYFNCSPKLETSWNDMKLRYRENVLKQIQETGRSIFKFVFTNNTDIDDIWQNYSFIDKHNIRVMPEWVLVDEHRQVFDNTIDYIVSSWYNVAIRCQSIMWDWAKRGV